MILLVLVVMDFASQGAVRSVARDVAVSIRGGLVRVGNFVALNRVFASRRALETENVELERKVAELSERAAAYEVLQQENIQLHALLSMPKHATGTVASIVSSTKGTTNGSALINVGEDERVQKGDLVETSGGFVVGRVEDVSAHTSRIVQVFAPGNKVDVVVGGANVVAEGVGDGNARLQVPRGIELAEGDPVISPVYGSVPVGVVGKIESETTSAYQTVYVRIPVSISALRYVYVAPAVFLSK